VTADIRRSDRQRSIKHGETKDESVASPSCFVSPVHPDTSTVSVRSTVDHGSNGTNHHRDEPSSQAEEDTESLNVIKPMVGEQDQEAYDAIACSVAAEDVPVPYSELRVEGFENSERLQSHE
jgi:hypothetical protein